MKVLSPKAYEEWKSRERWKNLKLISVRPSLIASELIQVQPMSAPTGLIPLFQEYKRSKKQNDEPTNTY